MVIRGLVVRWEEGWDEAEGVRLADEVEPQDGGEYLQQEVGFQSSWKLRIRKAHDGEGLPTSPVVQPHTRALPVRS
mgnify:CR=1 FL=1